jgi:hypothetical protein
MQDDAAWLSLITTSSSSHATGALAYYGAVYDDKGRDARQPFF